MKNFVKMTLAVLTGLLIAFILFTMFITSLVSTVSVSTTTQNPIPKNGILDINFEDMTIEEQTREIPPLESVQGEIITPIGIWDAIQALDAAASDSGVKFIYLRPDAASSGFAEIEEFRKALERCRNSGKPVIAYMENPSNAGYYLATAADKIYMTSCNASSNMLVGVSSQMFFLKDLFDKLGVKMQFIRHGKYKSAGEMYCRNDISPENRLQYEQLIGSIWNGWTADIAKSRNISQDRFNGLLDNLELVFPSDFVKNGLVDSLLTREQRLDKLASLYGVGDIKDVSVIPFADYVASRTSQISKNRNKIAVIFADGEIIDGKDKKEVAGDRFAAIIRKIRTDNDVKAVVLRVNSPGGSVTASEKIRQEIEALRGVKPVIASYGNYAASGGYWISNSCDKIFANATTLTGSIGVFSMIPDMSATARDLAHVGVVTIGSNKHSDMYSMFRGLDDNELAYMQAGVEDIYDTFTGIVAEGRGMSVEAVDEIAQGRVWSGSDALRIGLVDEIGTLKDAIEYAASAAECEIGSDLSLWNIEAYPKPQTFLESIMEMVHGVPSQEGKASVPALKRIEYAADAIMKADAPKVMARLPYDIQLK